MFGQSLIATKGSPMSEQLDRFVHAKAEFDTIEKHAEMLFEMVRNQAALLQNWKTAGVAGSKFTFSHGGMLRVNPEQFFDASNWPSGERIAEMLSMYHRAGENARDAYGQLSEVEQRSVQPPNYHRFG
jgi:hypothetical protein